MFLTTLGTLHMLSKSITSPTLVEKGDLKHRKKRKGAAAVEFALVAPVFVLLVFGMIEYGRMVMVQQVITNASREGARRAVLDGATATDVSSTVTTYLTNGAVSGATVTMNPTNPATVVAGNPITVTVSVPYTAVSWLPAPFFLGNTTMTANSTMRRESVE
jgi:Flp pilus assembly protein TadG